jgi:hypothetical protein
MAKHDRPMALDGYTQLIIKADALGRPARQIKERPAPPAPMMAKPEAPAKASVTEKSPTK